MSVDLDKPSFGIVDTIATSSQELVDSFLDGSTNTDPDDIKDAKEVEKEEAIKVAKAKEAEVKKNKEEPKEELKEEEEVPFDLSHILDKDEPKEEEDEIPAKPSKTPKVEDSTKEDEKEEDFNPFAAFSKELYKLGAFMKEDDEEVEIPSTPEKFLETFNQQVGRRAEVAVDNFISKFGEDYQKAFDAIYVQGVSPKDYFQTYNNIQDFQSMDLTLESNQEAVVRQTLKDLDYEQEDINKEVEKLKSYGDLEETAKRHHKVLIKKEAQKLSQITEQQAEKVKQQEAIKRQFVQNVNTTLQDKLKAKDFDGIPLNPKLATEVQDMLLNEKWKNSAGESLTDFDVEILNLKRPENHAQKVKLAVLLKILKQDPTLSTIKKAAVTTQTNALFSEVARNVPKQSVKKSGPSPFNTL